MIEAAHLTALARFRRDNGLAQLDGNSPELDPGPLERAPQDGTRKCGY